MLILDTHPTNESSALDQLLRNGWARLWAWLRRQSQPADRADDDKKKHDRTESLIL
jgi:hypothetical protein